MMIHVPIHEHAPGPARQVSERRMIRPGPLRIPPLRGAAIDERLPAGAPPPVTRDMAAIVVANLASFAVGLVLEWTEVSVQIEDWVRRPGGLFDKLFG